MYSTRLLVTSEATKGLTLLSILILNKGVSVDMLEGMAVVQRDLEKLEEWVGMKLIITNKDKRKLIHLGRSISLYNCRCWTLTA